MINNKNEMMMLMMTERITLSLSLSLSLYSILYTKMLLNASKCVGDRKMNKWGKIYKKTSLSFHNQNLYRKLTPG